MFTFQFFTSAGGNFIDMFNAKAAAHAACDALGESVRKRKLSPAHSPSAPKSLKTIEVVPYRFFSERETQHSPNESSSWSDDSQSADEESSADSGGSITNALRCESSFGSKLASSDATMKGMSLSERSASSGEMSDAATDGSSMSAPASLGSEPGMHGAQEQAVPEDVPMLSKDDSQLSALEHLMDAELYTLDTFLLPDGTDFRGTRFGFHERLWGNPEWRDVCTKEMTRMEYLDMLRRHEPEKYKITLLALDATAYAYE